MNIYAATTYLCFVRQTFLWMGMLRRCNVVGCAWFLSYHVTGSVMQPKANIHTVDNKVLLFLFLFKWALNKYSLCSVSYRELNWKTDTAFTSVSSEVLVGGFWIPLDANRLAVAPRFSSRLCAKLSCAKLIVSCLQLHDRHESGIDFLNYLRTRQLRNQVPKYFL